MKVVVTSLIRAKEIMGKNFFGIEEAVRHLGVYGTESHRIFASHDGVPFKEEVLLSCKDMHILVAVFPLSILDIYDVTKDTGLIYKQDYCYKEPFAKEKNRIGWQLFKKTPVDKSMGKDWAVQQACLSKDEKTPTASLVVYVTIGHFLNTDERLFEKVYVRTSTIDSNHHRVFAGRSAAKNGMNVGYWDDYGYRGYVGLSSIKKH